MADVQKNEFGRQLFWTEYWVNVVCQEQDIMETREILVGTLASVHVYEWRSKPINESVLYVCCCDR
jgi:hypothetical protein